MTRDFKKPADIRAAFESSNALLTGHFLLSSGLHSPNYMQCALVLADPELAAWLGQGLAEALRAARLEPDLIVSPAMGGLFIGQEVARALGLKHYFAERENGVMTMRRGFSLKPGQRVVIVEDVVTTGKSSLEVMALLRAMDARVLGLASIVDRGSPDVGVPKVSLLSMDIPSFKPDACPLCKEDKPLIKPGSRTQPK
jgi:orotate phosphoribosyltransferase